MQYISKYAKILPGQCCNPIPLTVIKRCKPPASTMVSGSAANSAVSAIPAPKVRAAAVTARRTSGATNDPSGSGRASGTGTGSPRRYLLSPHLVTPGGSGQYELDISDCQPESTRKYVVDSVFEPFFILRCVVDGRFLLKPRNRCSALHSSDLAWSAVQTCTEFVALPQNCFIVAKYTLWIPSNNTHLANFHISLWKHLLKIGNAVISSCPYLSFTCTLLGHNTSMSVVAISHNTAKRCGAQGEWPNVLLGDRACFNLEQNRVDWVEHMENNPHL